METRKRIKQLLLSTERKGIENLIEWMENEGFFDAPCSSKYHMAEPGGLAKHSLNVFQASMQIALAYYSEREDEITFDFINAITLSALLHDIGKTGQFGKPIYIENEDPEQGAYKTNRELLYVPHEVRSIAIISKFIDLTEEEQYAILYHNGLYGDLKNFKGRETPLLMILHSSDMWASRVIEKESKNENTSN